MSANAVAAAAYAKTGWPVFPAVPDNPRCPDPDACACKAPVIARGLLAAETDPRTVARWWARHPDANVAIATGAPGPDVLDVDVTHGRPGPKMLNAAIRAGLVPSPRAATRTGTGGNHLYYDGTAQRSGSLKDQGLDFRAAGGYVIAPPSRVHGRPYVVVSHGGQPATIDFAKIREHFCPQPDRPAWQPRPGQHGVGHLADWMAGIKPGNRDNALFWAACRAAEAGDDATLDALAAAAKTAGLDNRSIERTIRSAVRTASPKAHREAG